MTLSMCIFGDCNVVGWDGQISEIYESSMECVVAARVEVGDDVVGKLQGFFNALHGGISDMVSV